jgi:hypothetical protein
MTCLFTSALNLTCLVQSALNPTCLLQVSHFSTHLYLGSGPDYHSDSDSCAPEVMVPDARVFSSMKNEQKYPWLYDSVVHQGYLCKFCELLFPIRGQI